VVVVASYLILLKKIKDRIPADHAQSAPCTSRSSRTIPQMVNDRQQQTINRHLARKVIQILTASGA
jgi:hypothetical protein